MPGARDPAQVQPDVEPLWIRRPPDGAHGSLQQRLELGVLVGGQLLEIADVTKRHHQQVPRVVRELVQDHEGELTAREDAFVLGLRDRAEDAAVAAGSSFASWMYSMRQGLQRRSATRSASEAGLGEGARRSSRSAPPRCRRTHRPGASSCPVAVAHGDVARLDLPVAHHQGVRDLHQLGRADLLATVSFGVVDDGRRPRPAAARPAPRAYSTWRSATGTIRICSGASHSGKAPA